MSNYLVMNIQRMQALADKGCTCTEDEKSGEAFTFCPTCLAASFLCEIEDIIQEYNNEISF